MTHRKFSFAILNLSLLAAIFAAHTFAQNPSFSAEPTLPNTNSVDTTYFHNVSVGGRERSAKRISTGAEGSIKGRVLSDVNAPSGTDPEPVGGVRVILKKIESGVAAIVDHCISDAKGRYDFPSLPAGIYSIEVDPISIPARFLRTEVKPSPSKPEVTTEAKGQDPGTSGRTIKGNVFVDKNSDGKYDPKTDELVAGAFITANGRFAVSGANGVYTLTQLPAGRTSVVASVPGVNKNSQVIVDLDFGSSPTRVVDLAVAQQRSSSSNDDFNLLENEDDQPSKPLPAMPSKAKAQSGSAISPSTEKIFVYPSSLVTPVSYEPTQQTSRSRTNAATKPTMGKGSSLRGYSSGDDLVDAYIVESSRRYRIDPLLIYAQMGQESSFKPRAISNKGATGLMQLMPATARRLGVASIYDPKQNIEGGVKYMRILLDMFDGDLNLALAGYNAGEGAVIKYGYKIPPYGETMNYVRRISSRYSKISGSPMPVFDYRSGDSDAEVEWTVPPPPNRPESGTEMLRRYQRPPIAANK